MTWIALIKPTYWHNWIKFLILQIMLRKTTFLTLEWTSNKINWSKTKSIYNLCHLSSNNKCLTIKVLTKIPLRIILITKINNFGCWITCSKITAVDSIHNSPSIKIINRHHIWLQWLKLWAVTIKLEINSSNFLLFTKTISLAIPNNSISNFLKPHKESAATKFISAAEQWAAHKESLTPIHLPRLWIKANQHLLHTQRHKWWIQTLEWLIINKLLCNSNNSIIIITTNRISMVIRINEPQYVKHDAILYYKNNMSIYMNQLKWSINIIRKRPI